MVAQQKAGDPIPEKIDEDHRNPESANATPAGADTADDLINALDNLLLERALEEHRVALARLNELKLALKKGQA